MLGVFQRLTQSNLIPQRIARREMEQELARGRAAEAELQRSYRVLEERVAERAKELASANEELLAETKRCKDVEARFNTISESIPFGAWIYELDGTTQQVSKSYLELIGATKESAMKTAWFNLIHPEDRKRVAQLWKEAVAARIPWDCEFRVVSKSGEVRYLLSRGAPLQNAEGEVHVYAGFQFDVTDRAQLREEMAQLKSDLEQQVQTKTEELREANRHLLLDLAERMKTELALRDSESQLRAMFENALDSMILLDNERRVLDANEAALELFGFTIEEMRKLRWDSLIPPMKLAEVEERWKTFLKEGSKRGEMALRGAAESSRVVNYSARANILPGRHLVTISDMTGRREAEDSLRLLSHRLMRLQDDERRRIARELHDSTGQCLAALGMHLDAITAAAPKLPAKARGSLREAVEICRTCTADIRTISYLLHPPLLDEVGLLPAVEWYLSGFSERSGIQVTREIAEPSRAISMELNTALYRIIQEGLVNIHKHANSKQAKIHLRGDEEKVVLEISDNGKGIDPERLRNRQSGVDGLGVGITGMRERVRQLGGSIEFLAMKPGTKIRVTFPLMGENHGNTESVGR